MCEFLNEFRTDCWTMFCPITSTCYLQSNDGEYEFFKDTSADSLTMLFTESPVVEWILSSNPAR